MQKNNQGSKNHLTKYLRFQILKFLSLDYDVPRIAKHLGFNKSTIYRELTRNSIIENKRHVGFTNPERMPCKNNLHCRNKKQGCIATCKNYMPLTCSLITKPHQVCNFCPRRKGCRFERIIYHPEIACDIADAYLANSLGSGWEWWKNFYEFHKLAIDELDAFDYEEYKKNGFKVKYLGNYDLSLDFDQKPE